MQVPKLTPKSTTDVEIYVLPPVAMEENSQCLQGEKMCMGQCELTTPEKNTISKYVSCKYLIHSAVQYYSINLTAVLWPNYPAEFLIFAIGLSFTFYKEEH